MLLQTERLDLRPLRSGDGDRLFALMSDPDVTAYWDWPALEERAAVELVLESQLDRMSKGEATFWAAQTRPDGAFAGVCDVSRLDGPDRACEVGFMLAPAYWGRGLGFEAVRAVLIHAAGEGFARVRARIHAENVRCARLLARLGFDEAEPLRDYEIRPGVRRDCRVFELALS